MKSSQLRFSLVVKVCLELDSVRIFRGMLAAFQKFFKTAEESALFKYLVLAVFKHFLRHLLEFLTFCGS